jgi:hypothetical protein
LEKRSRRFPILDFRPDFTTFSTHFRRSNPLDLHLTIDALRRRCYLGALSSPARDQMHSARRKAPFSRSTVCLFPNWGAVSRCLSPARVGGRRPTHFTRKGKCTRSGWFPPPPWGPDPGLCNAIADCFWFLQPVTATAGDFAVHSRRKIRGPWNRSFCHLFRSIRNLHKINNPSMAPEFDVKGRRMDALPPKRRKDDRKCTSKSASSIYLSHPETSTAKKNETKIPQSHVYL